MDVSTVNLVLNLIRPNPIGIASALPCSALFCPPLVSSRLLSYPLLPSSSSSSSTPPLAGQSMLSCLVLSCLPFQHPSPTDHPEACPPAFLSRCQWQFFVDRSLPVTLLILCKPRPIVIGLSDEVSVWESAYRRG
jgi:hypothetical protein